MFLTFKAQSQLSSSGSETLINTTIASNQQRPAVAMGSNGNYVVAWESQSQDGDGYGIYAAIYDNIGTVIIGELLVNSTTDNDQRFPDIAMASSGKFVIVWQSYDEDGDNWGIYFQRYNSSNSAEGSQILVNSTISGRQCMPKIAMDDSGNFGITWESDGEIYAATYSSDGTSIASEFQINTTTTNSQNYPNIAMDSDGNFVIAWQSYDQDGDGFGIYHQRYNSSAVAQGTEILVNTTTSGQQAKSSVSMAENGNYIIVWTDNSADGDEIGVFGQLFNADGTTDNSEFQVNTTVAGAQDNPQVAMGINGEFSVVWDSYGQDGQYMGVYNQSYNADASTSGAEILINTTTDYFQQFPAIDLWANSETVIVWQDGQLNESNSLDADGYGVVFQRYDAAVLPIELLYFYAEKTEEGVLLDWQTTTEINNAYFDVEWSMNGIDFEKIGQILGAGTTNEPQFYELLHKTPIVGNNYYRLKQVDFDDKFEYSNILNIEYQTEQIEYRIFPNPTSNFINIENGIEGEIVQIFNASGQLVESFSLQSPITHHNVSNFPKGIYFIKIGTTVKRILIQ